MNNTMSGEVSSTPGSDCDVSTQQQLSKKRKVADPQHAQRHEQKQMVEKLLCSNLRLQSAAQGMSMAGNLLRLE